MRAHTCGLAPASDGDGALLTLTPFTRLASTSTSMHSPLELVDHSRCGPQHLPRCVPSYSPSGAASSGNCSATAFDATLCLLRLLYVCHALCPQPAAPRSASPSAS